MSKNFSVNKISRIKSKCSKIELEKINKLLFDLEEKDKKGISTYDFNDDKLLEFWTVYNNRKRKAYNCLVLFSMITITPINFINPLFCIICYQFEIANLSLIISLILSWTILLIIIYLFGGELMYTINESFLKEYFKKPNNLK